MTTTVRTTDTAVTLERDYAASPQRLFAAWTDPALLARWMAPSPRHTARAPLLEARKGGRFRIEMRGPGPDGAVRDLVYTGTFEEVVPGQRLVMTWEASGEPKTTVTVTFTPVAGGTRMRLVHEGLPGRGWAEGAAYGWRAALEALAGLG